MVVASMSRGRGKAPRGRGFGSQLEALGITSAGDSAPPPILQPPPLFPPLDRKPLEIKNTDVDVYLLEVKQELRAFMRESGFYLVDDSDVDPNHVGKKAKVERGAQEWVPEWQYFPKELEVKKRKVKKTTDVTKAKPKMAAKTVRKVNKAEEIESVFDESEVLKAASMSPKKSSTVEQSLTEGKPSGGGEETEEKTEKGEEKDSEEEAGEEEEYYDEELEEEGTDYNLTYFDPGEDYGDDDDGGGGDEREGTYY